LGFRLNNQLCRVQRSRAAAAAAGAGAGERAGNGAGSRRSSWSGSGSGRGNSSGSGSGAPVYFTLENLSETNSARLRSVVSERLTDDGIALTDQPYTAQVTDSL